MVNAFCGAAAFNPKTLHCFFLSHPQKLALLLIWANGQANLKHPNTFETPKCHASGLTAESVAWTQLPVGGAVCTQERKGKKRNTSDGKGAQTLVEVFQDRPNTRAKQRQKTRSHRATTRSHRATTRTHRATTRLHRATTRTHRATTRTHKAIPRSHRAITRSHRAKTRTHRASPRSHRA